MAAVPVVRRARSRRALRVLPPAAVALLALAGVVLVHVVDPNQPGHYPSDPFLALTGWWCPGCGSLRALHALTEGRPGVAMQRNPVFVLALPVAVALWAEWLLAAVRGRPVRVPHLPAWVAWALLVALPLWWVARNVPGWTWASPA